MRPASHEVELSRAFSLVIEGGISLELEDGLDKIVLVRVKLRFADVRCGPASSRVVPATPR